MPIPVACLCGKRLQAPDALAGKEARCPACSAMIQVPDPHDRALRPILDPVAPPAAPAASRPASSPGVERCEYCGGAMAIGSPFHLDGDWAKPLGAAGGIGSMVLVWLIGPCPIAMILLGILAIGLIAKGFGLGYRCTQCRLRPSGALPDGVAGDLSRERLKAFGGAGASAVGSMACLAFIVWVVASGLLPDGPGSSAPDAPWGGQAGPARQPDPAPPVPREPTIDERLRDPDPAIRLAALRELAGSQPDASGTVARLRNLRRDADPGVRREAIEALDRALPLDRFDEFHDALADEDPGVAGAAAAALDRRGPAAWVGALAREGSRARAEDALRKAGRASIDPLVAALGDRSDVVRRAAAALLLELSGREKAEVVAPVLVAELEAGYPRPENVRWAAEALVGMGPPQSRLAIPALAKLLLGTNEPERVVWAAGLLARFEDPGPEEALESLLRLVAMDACPEAAREHVVTALGHVGKPAIEALGRRVLEGGSAGRDRWAEALDALDPDARGGILAAALADPAGKHRLTALRQLTELPAGSMDPERRLALVVEALETGTPDFQRQVLEAIRKMGPAAAPAAPAVLARLGDGRNGYEARSTLQAMGPSILDELVRGFDSRPKAEQTRILEVIHSFGPEAAPASAFLARHLADEALDDVAKNALGRIGAPALPHLVEVLRGPSDAAKDAAIDALRAMKQDAAPAMEALVELHVSTGETRLRNLSLGAIHEIRDGAVAALRKSLRLKDVEARRRALALLARFEGEESVEAIATALDDRDAGIRADAARMLGGAGAAARGAVRELTKLLSDPEQRVRMAACEALGKIGSEAKSALPAIRKLLASDPSLKYYAERAIEAIEGKGR